MPNNERLMQAIFSAIDEVNQQLPKAQRVEKSIDNVLFGKTGKLDSLGLVNLIVATEQKIEEEFKITISLTDEKTMSRDNSPFKSIKTLTEHIAWLLEDKTGE